MRKLFDERARLVIYLEREDLEKFEEEARRSGKTAQELARELVTDAKGNHDTGRTGQPSEVSVVGRGVGKGRRKPGESLPAAPTDAGVGPGIHCEHGAEWRMCEKWGCKNYKFKR